MPPRYLLATLAAALGFVALFGLSLVALDRAGSLPPPQIANNLCLDEKLRFLRASSRFDEPSYQPSVMAVGSSVSWRTIDGEAIEGDDNGPDVFFNGGFCGLNAAQTTFTARYFLGRYPTVREVVTIVAPQDLTQCRTPRPRLFDPEDVDSYVYDDAWAFWFYLKYFDPYTFAKNIFRLQSLWGFRWGLVFDRFGGSPIDTQEQYTKLVYGTLPPYDDACFAALRELAAELHRDGRRLVVAPMPMHPAWLARHDPQHQRMQEFARRIDEALAGTSAVHWRPQRFALREQDFVDAIHIRWSAAREFSRALVEETDLGRTTATRVLGEADAPATGESPSRLMAR